MCNKWLFILLRHLIYKSVTDHHLQTTLDHYGTPQQITSVSKTSVYDNVDIDDDPASSEQQTNHPYVNVKYNVQPAGPNITVPRSYYYSHDTHHN